MLLSDSANNEGGAAGQTIFAKNDPNTLTKTLATATQTNSIEIQTGAEVVGITSRDGRATGVALASGEEIIAPVAEVPGGTRQQRVAPPRPDPGRARDRRDRARLRRREVQPDQRGPDRRGDDPVAHRSVARRKRPRGQPCHERHRPVRAVRVA